MSQEEIIKQLLEIRSRDADVAAAEIERIKSETRWNRLKVGALLLVASVMALVYGTSLGTVFFTPEKEHAAMVRMDGVISAGEPADANAMIGLLRGAFEAKSSKSVILVINSPGGSPAQSEIIHKEIVSLKEKHDKKLYVVAEDALASGAYLVATAADAIYVQGSTIVGSIGVVHESYGVGPLMGKVGVDYRQYTAGKNKRRITPFEEPTKEDVEHLQGVLDDVHSLFIDYVVQGRGEKLTDDPNLFSGDVWLGQEAVDLGLADGVMTMTELAVNELDDIDIRRYANRDIRFFLQELGVRMGGGVIDGMVRSIEQLRMSTVL